MGCTTPAVEGGVRGTESRRISTPVADSEYLCFTVTACAETYDTYDTDSDTDASPFVPGLFLAFFGTVEVFL